MTLYFAEILYLALPPFILCAVFLLVWRRCHCHRNVARWIVFSALLFMGLWTSAFLTITNAFSSFADYRLSYPLTPHKVLKDLGRVPTDISEPFDGEGYPIPDQVQWRFMIRVPPFQSILFFNFGTNGCVDGGWYPLDLKSAWKRNPTEPPPRECKHVIL